jgi:predicted MPP superfamily phosphohydrolase
MKIRVFQLLVLVTWALHAWIGWRLLPDLQPGITGQILGIAVLVASCVLMPFSMVARFIRVGHWSQPLVWAGLIAMGAFSSLLVLTVLRELALLGLWLAESLSGSPLRAGLAGPTAWSVVVLSALLTALGWRNARRRARVVDVNIPVENLPASLEGFRIVQLSDVHVGPTIKAPYLEAIVSAVNSLHPDVVAITGDLVDGSVKQLAPHTRPLQHLRARYGSYFVTGNHEYYSGAHGWIDHLRELGLFVLLNEHVVVDHGGERLVLAGVTDYTAHHFDPAHRSDPQRAIAGAPADVALKILLAHQPRSAAAALAAGFDLQLSGHTHGGQFLPWNFFVRFQQPWTAGLNRLERLWVYTSRGTGYWGPPKRLGAPSEITCLRLVRAD